MSPEVVVLGISGVSLLRRRVSDSGSGFRGDTHPGRRLSYTLSGLAHRVLSGPPTLRSFCLLFHSVTFLRRVKGIGVGRSRRGLNPGVLEWDGRGR